MGRYIKIYGALGTLYAKQTSNRIAANDCLEPKAVYAISCCMRAQDRFFLYKSQNLVGNNVESPPVHAVQISENLTIWRGFQWGVRYLQAKDITRFHTPSLSKGKLKK